MLFSVWTGDLHRPTKDIDLLGFGSNDIDVLVNDFKIICATEADDGLIFDIESIQGVRIKEDSLYQGSESHRVCSFRKSENRFAS